MGKKVIFINNEKALKNYLKKHSPSRGRYFSWTILSNDALKALSQANFSRVNKPKFGDDFKSRFIEGYADLIVSITKENNNRIWLSSDAASKNRFSSDLPFLLEKFVLISEVIRKEDYDILVVLKQPWATQGALEGSLKAQNIKAVFLTSQFKEQCLLLFGHLRKIAAAVKNGLKVYARGVYARRLLKKKLAGIQEKKIDYVIKTFVYDKSSPRNEVYSDAFFGRLPEYLNNRKNILVLANVLGNYKACLKDFARCQSYTILPFEAFVSLKDILTAFKGVIFQRMHIQSEVTFFNYNIHSILKRIVLDKAQFHQLLHYYAVKSLISSTSSIKSFVMTYENYPWERMCILALREFSNSTKIIGYQHTVVPEAFLNMFIRHSEIGIVPHPDKILTTGEGSRSIIEQYSELESIELDSACGLRFEYLFGSEPNYVRRQVQNILVALEIGYEQYEIVQYLLNELKGKKLDVRIRAHPNFPWKRYEQRFGCRLGRYDNFSDSSSNTLKEDLDWADVVIYSGTTVGLEGLMLGKPAIHFDRGAILSFDPLFKCRDFKWTLSCDDSFTHTLDEINALSEEEFRQKRIRAQDYTRAYFYPINEKNLEKFTV